MPTLIQDKRAISDVLAFIIGFAFGVLVTYVGLIH